MKTDRLVDDYMTRLERAAVDLPPARRAELVTQIREHIDTSLQHMDSADEVAIRNVLERLGTPEEIAEAAGPPPRATRRPRPLEVVAVVALVVPFMGWLIGLVLVLVSRVWSRREKAVGVLLLAVPIVLMGLGLTLQRPSGAAEPIRGGPDVAAETVDERSDTGVGPLELMLVLLDGVPSAVYLGWRLRTKG
jgi:hypothetical protein